MNKHHHQGPIAESQIAVERHDEWLPIELAPLDGTIVEINAQLGPTLCSYLDLKVGDGPQWWVVEPGIGRCGAIAYPTHWRPVRIEAHPVPYEGPSLQLKAVREYLLNAIDQSPHNSKLRFQLNNALGCLSEQ